MNTKKAEKVIKQVAKKYGVSVEEARREIENAISDARMNTEPSAQAFWRSLPYKGEKPTPEEVLTYLAQKLKS